MKERIKKILNESKLTQVKFADKIGISRTGLQKLISGENNPSEQTIRAICNQFKVNREWLEEGIEPMYQPNAPTSDDELIDEVLAGEDEFIKAFIKGIAKSPGGWEKMRDVFSSIQAELDKINSPEDDESSSE